MASSNSRWSKVFHESWKYFLVSALSLGLDLGVYWLLVNVFRIHYLVANPVGVSLGLLANYALSVRLVFTERRLSSRRAEFIAFVLIGLAGLAVNEALIASFVGGLGLGPVLGKVGAAGGSFVFNFGARKLLLFSKRNA